ncbi:MAG: hypothetical protein H7144_12230 [Burkholderiales bacterium]|nr:hypothetical protein [Phycisphaerae bacterium]
MQHESEDTFLLREIRDLLRLVAEPQIAARDKSQRTALREVVGKSKKSQNAVLLMTGENSQGVIASKAGIDGGQLSRLITRLREIKLLSPSEKPKLLIPITPQLFEVE